MSEEEVGFSIFVDTILQFAEIFDNILNMDNTKLEVNNVYLIGAGFDRAVFDEKAPLNDELLSELKKISKGKDKEFLEKYFKKHPTENIEEFLTFLDLDILSLPDKETEKDGIDLKQLRGNINSLIAEYFSQLRFKESIVKEKSWLGRFVTQILVKNDVIVDLNYSTFFGALLDYYEVWSPNGGYSEFITNWLTEVGRKNFPKNKDKKNILLHKIHGCENFRQCPMLGDSLQTYIGIKINSNFFPKSSQYASFGAGIPDVAPYIIAPSYIKIPHEQIERLIIDTIERMNIAQNLIIIGCGLRPEDSTLWLMLTNFFKKVYTRSMEKKVIIIDSKKADFVGARIEKHFGSMV